MPQETPRRTSDREKKRPERLQLQWDHPRLEKRRVVQHKEMTTEDSTAQGNSSEVGKSAQFPSFVEKMFSFSPFKSKKTPSTTSSSSEVRRARLEAEHEKKKVELQDQIEELEQTLEIEQIEVEDMKRKLSQLEEKLSPDHPDHEADNLFDLRKSVAHQKEKLGEEEIKLKKSKVTTSTKIKKLIRQIECIDRDKSADLAQIDEDEEQCLGSDEDEGEKDLDALAEEFKQWRESAMKVDIPPPPPSDVQSKTLDTIVQALQSLTVVTQNQVSSSTKQVTEKMVVRQSIGRDLPFFSGKTTEWPSFIATYKRTTEACGFTDAENLERLRKCLKGEAMKSVECLLVSPSALPEVLQLLEDRFGQAGEIVWSMIKNMRTVPTVKDDKPETMVNFGTAVTNLVATIKNLEQVEHLRNPVLLRELEDKLPMMERKFWEMHIDTIAKDYSLEDFATWIKTRVKKAHRLCSQKDEEEKEKQQPKDSKAKKARVYQHEDLSTAAGLHSGEAKVCIFCGKSNHKSQDCFTAEKMPWKEKSEMLKKSRSCFKCMQFGHRANDCKVKLKCSLCEKSHHKIMCSLLPSNARPEVKMIVAQEDSPIPATTGVNANHVCRTDVLTKTLLVRVVGPKGSRVVRLMFDEGSQLSCGGQKTLQAVGSKQVGEEWGRNVLFGGALTEARQIKKFKVQLESLDGSFKKEFTLRESPTICGEMPRVPSGPWINEAKKKKIFLSDWSMCHVDSPDIEILIGSDFWNQLILSKPMMLTSGLGAVKTVFGYVLSGKVPEEVSGQTAGMMVISSALVNTDVNIQEMWNLDTLGITDPSDHKTKKEKEEETKQHFFNTVSVTEDGRYSVQLPWIDGRPEIPDNKSIAEKRLINATAKLIQKGKFKEYDSIFKDWEKEGFVERVTLDTNRGYYLPHRPVFKEESKTTPVRPVFDASCKVGRSPSLNDCLHKGPNLLEKIPSLLLRFMEKKIGVISDIRKAFQMIEVSEPDRDFLKFLWWENYEEKKLMVYRHKRVVFGVNASPFHLGAVIEHHGNRVDPELRPTSQKFLQSLYVDNCVTSVDTIQEYEDFRAKTVKMMADAKMDLRQWEYTGQDSVNGITVQELSPVLGLRWNKQKDTLSVDIPMVEIPFKLSKRAILSQIQRIFDPMGFLSPAVLVPKLLLQRAWSLQAGWDDELTVELRAEFEKWWMEVPELAKIEIPRYAFKNDQNVQFHVFSDASRLAYSAAVFIRVEEENGVTVQLLQSKARVGPLKEVSIPRLELLGCTIAARLATSVKVALSMEDKETHYWSDSTTALAWIHRNDEWGTFVGNRVKEICALTNSEAWKHVPGLLNPADLPSRGCTPEQLLKSRWWEGPEWLRKQKEEWPSSEEEADDDLVLIEKKKKATVNLLSTESTPPWYMEIVKRSSTYQKAIRIMAWIQRAVRIFKKDKKIKKKGIELERWELDVAEKRIIQFVQSECFTDEDLISGLKVERDGEGLIRVKTKIVNLPDMDTFVRPYLLPKSHPVVSLVIRQEHIRNQHAGVQYMMAHLRERFWIIKSRQAINKVIGKCVTCRRFTAKRLESVGAPLPQDRIKTAKVFQVVGIDLAGPLFLKDGTKAWMVLFTCAVYRAVHLELVTSLSTEAFLLALHRFICRRGRPYTIYTDNGTNFEGANNAFKLLDWKQIERETEVDRITWKFNPATGSWWGGFWERLIRSCKDLLKRMLGNKKLTLVQLETCMFEVEAVINGRPLTYVSENDEDLVPLTPAMFLHDIQGSEFPEEEALDAQALRNKNKSMKQLREELRARFRKEYLAQLVQRGKEKKMQSFQVGDVVLVGSDDKKRQLWPMAKIMDLKQGRDGHTRVAILKTKSGLLTRPIQRLYPLEVSSYELPDKKEVPSSRTEEENQVNEVAVRTRFGRKIKRPIRLGE